MSAMCGIFHRHAKPVTASELRSMTATFPAQLQSNISEVLEGPIGLAFGGTAVTMAGSADAHILNLMGGKVLFCGFATLSNREEILTKLALGADEARTHDFALLALAYEKWGEKCTDHLAGIWIFAAWDREVNCLLLMRDHMSYLEISYALTEQHFCFGFRPRTVMALPFVAKEINLDRVAQTLMVLRDDAHSSPWKGISYLAPGHCLTVDAQKSAIKFYWPIENVPEIYFPNDDDYIEALREKFDTVTANYLRCSGPVAMTLSGGLDSATVAESAGRQAQQLGKRIGAFTAVPIHSTQQLTETYQFADESPYARAVAERMGNIDLHMVESRQITPILGLRRSISQSDSLDYGVGNSYWLWNMLDDARQNGYQVMLNGSGGNATISWAGAPLVRSYTSWPPKLSTLHQWSKRHEQPMRQAIRSLFFNAMIPDKIEIWRRSRYSSRYASWQGYSSMNPDYYAQGDFEQRILLSGRDPMFKLKHNSDNRAQQIFYIRPDRRTGHGGWSHFALGSGVQPRDPTGDHRIAEFCIGIPQRQYQRDATERLLVRRLLDGRIPDEVVWNKKRGLQGADVCLRLRETAGEVEAVLGQIEQSAIAREMLDVPRMRSTFREIIEGPLTPRLALSCELILMRGIGAGLFLLEAGQ